MKKAFLRTAALLLIFAMMVVSLCCCTGKGSENIPDTDLHSTTDITEDSSQDTADTEAGNTDAEQGVSIEDLTPSSGDKLKIAFVGDSITQGTGAAVQSIQSYPAQLQYLLDSNKYQVGNFGKASAYTLAADNKYNVKEDASLTYKATQQYRDSVAFCPDVVVIMLGVNDIRSISHPDARAEFKAALSSLAAEYAAMESVSRVYIATSILVPNQLAIIQYSGGELQELQREVAEEGGYHLIDIFGMTYEYMSVMMHSESGDRIHPNAKMYVEMAKAFYAGLMGEQYQPTVPEKSDSGVVYVAQNGMKTGKGATPETAVKSIAYAAGLLRDGGGIIVICGPYSLSYETNMPKHTGTIKITSVYDGVDWRTQGAKLGLAYHFILYGDYIFEKLNIVNETLSIITCNYNNVTFGEGITTTRASSVTADPTIVVGYTVALGGVTSEAVSFDGECNVTVKSGKWSYINCGNRRSNAGFAVGVLKEGAKVNVTVDGGEFTLTTGANFGAATGMNSIEGEINLTLNGGKFHGKLFAIGRVGSNTTTTPSQMKGRVNITVNGGEYLAGIHYRQDNTTSISGEVCVSVVSGYESVLFGFSNVNVK